MTHELPEPGAVPFRWLDMSTRDAGMTRPVLAWFKARPNASDHLGDTMRERFGVRLVAGADGSAPAFVFPVPGGGTREIRLTGQHDAGEASRWRDGPRETAWYGLDQAAGLVAETVALRRLVVAADEPTVWRLQDGGVPAVCLVFADDGVRRASPHHVQVLHELVPWQWQVVVAVGERGRGLAAALERLGNQVQLRDADVEARIDAYLEAEAVVACQQLALSLAEEARHAA